MTHPDTQPPFLVFGAPRIEEAEIAEVEACLRSGWLGVAVGLIAVGLAAASLIIDFDSIKRGVDKGVPAKLAWVAAFGLVVTLIWLYLELLRLLAIFRN